MNSDLAYSRPRLSVSQLGEHAADAHRFLDKRVLVRIESQWSSDRNLRECLLTAARLAIRVCRHLTVQVPADDERLLRDAYQVAANAPPGSVVATCLSSPDFHEFDAILNVGTSARADLPWTVANADGWLARVSSRGQPLPGVTGRSNPIAAVAAASLGIADVFKRLIRLSAARGSLLDATSLSLMTYQVGEVDLGPDLAPSRTLDLLVGGAGAIGTSVVHLLTLLEGWRGRVIVVDGDRYGPENCATSLLVGPTQVGQFKAEVAASLLRQRYQALGLPILLADAARQFSHDGRFPVEMLSGFDNIDARHEAQRLYPDLLADGSIGGFVAQVTTHQWGGPQACLECVFRHPPGARAEVVQALATGLSVERLTHLDDPLTEGDVAAAPLDKKEFLKSRVGKRLCAVVQEGIERLTESPASAPFAPSVPFVATMSAALMVAELAKAQGGASVLDGRYQLDMLRGPAAGLTLPQACRSDCSTVMRRGTIERWRSQRAVETTSER